MTGPNAIKTWSEGLGDSRMSEINPGSWSVERVRHKKQYLIPDHWAWDVVGDLGIVASLWGDQPETEQFARLMAAAPDLLHENKQLTKELYETRVMLERLVEENEQLREFTKEQLVQIPGIGAVQARVVDASGGEK